MAAIKFIAKLDGIPSLAIPAEMGRQLPSSGRVRVLVRTDDVSDEWQSCAH